MTRSLRSIPAWAGLLLLAVLAGCASDPLAWPKETCTARPWTRWWWMGSAVDRGNLGDLLGQYYQAGIGGVEICPIYGADEYEDQYIQFLSPKWMEMLDAATADADHLDMGVDMTTGTGWPMGGPWIGKDDASSNAKFEEFHVKGGEHLKENLPTDRLRCVVALSDTREILDILWRVKNGKIDWLAPPGNWRVCVVSQVGPVQKVKRAAPGGEGWVVDPFSVTALDHYLARFDQAFADYHGRLPRCQFHDSYEYVGDWTSDLFKEFKARRHYDLARALPALMGEGTPDQVGDAKCDYRQTMAELHLEYIRRWTEWCHQHGMLSREQAHGAPANILDLYAAADIPETECYEAFDEDNIDVHKCASSAAHCTGKQLASSESFTWLDEQFNVTLAEAKREADFLFLGGTNHILFHGIPYSPKDAPWPGWVFYASTDFSPTGGLWRDLPEFCSYITRCQSILQSGTPDNDVLLYLPIYDLWYSPKGMLIPLKIEGDWMRSMKVHDVALALWHGGYGFDEVSDAMLGSAIAVPGGVKLGGNVYKAVVVPPCRYMPLATRTELAFLRRVGVNVVETPTPQGTLDQLAELGVQPETMTQFGIRFIRRKWEKGENYFLVNWSGGDFSDWITLAKPAESVVLLDPMNSERTGVAKLRTDDQGRTQIFLQIKDGESRILRTFNAERVEGKPWPYEQTAGAAIPIEGTWNISFVDGGPSLPAAFQMDHLASWTNGDDPVRQTFAGTSRYEIEFNLPSTWAHQWVLDLGDVRDSAEVTLNGQPVGTAISPPYLFHVEKYLQPGQNVLDVCVTNVAANCIRDMDRRGVKWKIFHDPPNVMGIHHKPLDASGWPVRDAGMLGPVRLIPENDLSSGGGGG
jgi:hypothetical protein